MTRCPRRSLAPPLQKSLDPSVLERVKRDHGQPTAMHQQLFGRDEPAIELTKLVIDGDAEGLKGPSCGILSRFGFRHRGTHDFGELDRPFNRPATLRCGDRTGNSAGEPFPAEIVDQLCQLAFRQRRNQICGARDLAAHPHIERPVKAKRKAALWRIELHRGDPQIQGDARDWPDANRGE